MKPKLYHIAILLLLLTSCAHRVMLDVPLDSASALYKSYQETGFCLTCQGKVYNIHEGTYQESPMPLCNDGDIVMHTHPQIQPFPSPGDYYVWDVYSQRYGNRLFGILWSKGSAKFYEVGGE